MLLEAAPYHHPRFRKCCLKIRVVGVIASESEAIPGPERVFLSVALTSFCRARAGLVGEHVIASREGVAPGRALGDEIATSLRSSQ